MPVKKITGASTEEELVQETVRELRRRSLPDAIIAAVVIRLKYPDKPTEPVQDSMVCPICRKGKLHFSIASSNGHIWARCTTDDCVRFMQ